MINIYLSIIADDPLFNIYSNNREFNNRLDLNKN